MQDNTSTVVEWLRDGWQTYISNQRLLIIGSILVTMVLLIIERLMRLDTYAIASLVGGGLMFLLSFGFTFYCLLIARKESPSLGTILSAFRYPKLLWLGVLGGLVLVLSLIPGLLMGVAVFGPSKVAFQSRTMPLTLVIMYITMLIVMARYGFSPVLMMDKAVTVRRSLSRSSQLTKGSRTKLFMLSLIELPLAPLQSWFTQYSPWQNGTTKIWVLFLVGFAAWLASIIVINPWLTVAWLRVYDRLLEQNGGEENSVRLATS